MQVLLMRLYEILDTKGLSVLGEAPIISTVLKNDEMPKQVVKLVLRVYLKDTL